MQRPLALVVVGGILLAPSLILLVFPVLVRIFRAEDNKLRPMMLPTTGSQNDRLRRNWEVSARPTGSSAMKHTWFVAYETVRKDGLGHYRRRTKSFSSEEEAKSFARELIQSGTERITAGTINPVRPKRVLGSKQSITPWLAS